MKLSYIKSFRLMVTAVFLTVVILSGCKIPDKKAGVIDLLNKDNGDDVGNADVHLSVVKIKEIDTAIIYDLQAKYNKKLVGFQVSVPKNTSQNPKGFGNGVEIRSLGKMSDNFKNALAEIYKIKTDHNKKFVKLIDAAFVDLNIFAKSVVKNAKLDNTAFKELKLFFNTPDGDEAEIFFNINNDQTIIELPEKDEEYRELIIKLFTQQ